MLQPDKLKKLNDNARKMSEAGSSQEDIMAMRDAFIKQFGNEIPLKKKSVSESPSEDGSLVSPKSTKQTKKTSTTIPKKDEEEDYFTGAFGNVLRGFDSVVPLGIGDFVDDMARSVASGYRQGEVAQSANDLLLKGHKSSPEQIQKFIDANKNAQQLKPSAEMQNYNKIYEEEGKGFWGVIKGLANNPTIIPEVITSSLVSMATNTDALKAGGAALGAGATRGAVVGAAATPEFLGAGALPGAATGAASAIPYAFGLASSVVEAGATFGELLQEELGGKDLSKENVKAILENPEKLKSIRNKAIARGVIIGTVDALTGKLASGVGAKILSKSAAKSATGAATKGAVTRATAAGAGIESLGGSAGEATARGAIGQDMDVSEIALEGIAELPGGVRSTIQAKLAKPSYKVNGVNVQAQDIDDLIETMTPEQLASTKIDIKNDYEGRQFKIQDKIVTNSIKEQVKQANPELNEPSLDAITELEKSLKSLEGNTTQTGKDKAAALRQQIKNIQENQIQEEAVTETVAAETPDSTKKRTDRIAEIESIISNDDATFADTGNRPLLSEARTELQNELQNLKEEQDAIQEQSTTEVPVQSEAITSETLETGVPESGPEVVTEQTTQEEVTAPQTIIEEQALVEAKQQSDLQKELQIIEAPQKLIDAIPTDTTLREGFLSDTKNLSASLFGQAGVFDVAENAVKIGKFYSALFGGRDKILLHEAAHAATVTTMNDIIKNPNDYTAEQRQATEDIFNIYSDYSTNRTATARMFQPYGIKNQYEFVAEFISNKKFRDFVAKNNPNDTVGFKEILWGKILEMLGMSKKEISTERIAQIEKAIDTTLDASIERNKRAKEQVSSKTQPTTQEEIAKPVTAQAEVAQPQTIIEEQIAEPQVVSEENISQALNEQDLPGYDRAMSEVEGIIEKSKKRRVSEDKIADNVMSYVMGSKVYEDATDVQREALVRDVRKRFGIREKSAPSVAKLFGKIKDVKKITMREKDLLIKQIKDKAKGAKDAVVAFKKINQELAKDIDELVKTGKITAKQAANVIKKFSKVNPFSYKSVNGFVDYMSKLFNNADYANNLSNAKSLRKEIKKLSKNDKKNAQLTNLAAEFAKIDPSMVDNIENYNEQALKLKKAIEGSNLRGGKLNVADTVDINEVSGYVSETIEQQEIKIREQQIAELQDLLGVDASEFSAVEIEELLNPDAEIDSDKEKIIKASIKKAFDIYSSMIKEQIKTGVDAFTGDNVSYTEDQKELIRRFMNMDPNNMDVKDALAAIDSLVNFLVNQSTARMETVVQQYEKTQNAKEIADKGITSVPLRKYFSPKLGRFLAEQTSNIGLLLEKAFVGFNRSAIVKKAMGYYELANGAAKAVSQSNKIVDDYVKQFYDKKANGQEFNTLFNMVERGMTSFVIRNIIGNESKSKAEFARRKNLVKETIDALLEYGNEQERNEGAEYQKVYDKILKDSNTAEEVMSKVDNQNLEAVNWWIDQWSGKFDRLSDLALNIYNTVLGRDVNYTPDKFKKFSSDESIEDLSNNESAFVNNTDGVTYKKESSGLMKATRPETLPTNNKTKTPRSYIDLSFDKVNANAMYDALIDLETAAPIRGIEAFMNSPYFSKIIKSKEDAKLIRGRINNYIRNTRNKSMFSNDELSTAFKALNKIATLGASQALGGPTQPFKQVIPVAFNTFINSGGNLELSATFNPEFMKWFKESGFATGNRGIESLAEIDSINRLVEQAANSKGAKFWKAIEKANEKQLKVLLSNPDRWIAITSWKTYYEQSLKDQGKEPDYSKGEINETAANYAEEMVSRQQNVSDKNMSGNLFTAKDTPTTVLVKLLMPFGSFRMNQSTRIGSDMRVLEYWNTSSKEDKLIAARSLAGFATEQVMFKTISLAFALVFNEIASSVMGNTDDEEDEKRRDAIYKGQATGIITDIFSPLPIFDKPIQGMASYSLSTVQEAMDIPEDDMIALYGMGKEDFSKGLGMFGITIGRSSEIYETIGLALTGKYKDNFGRTKQISEDKRSSLSTLIGPMLVSNITGVASPEVSSIVRNSVRYAKKSPKPIDKELLKKNSPEEYEKMYGKGGTMYKIEERKKEIEKRLEEIKKRR